MTRTVASHYLRDAFDFSRRFDTLWERELHKTDRIKSFVDLVMGFECALKSHIFLANNKDDPIAVYKEVRKFSHDIRKLAERANYLENKAHYKKIADRLGGISIMIRYSLDAYETFFPTMFDDSKSLVKYSETIGNNTWVLETRRELDVLLDIAGKELTGVVDSNLESLIEHERQMKQFVDECMR